MFMTASFITSQSGNKMSINQRQDKQDVQIIQLCKKMRYRTNLFFIIKETRKHSE